MSLCGVRILAFLWLFFATSLLASMPRITEISINGGELELRFDNALPATNFKHFTLNNGGGFRDVYDISAILATKNLPTELDNIKLRIAQNDPAKVRIVLSSNQELKSTLSVIKNIATIKVSGTDDSKSSGNTIIASLFGNVDTEKSQSVTESTSKNEKSKSTTNKKETKPQVSTKQSHKTISTIGTGKRIVLDPGHGGKDCGAIGAGKVCEKDVVLKVSKYLAEELKERGYNVFLTRTTDIFITLRNRTKFANDKDADLFISIHANAVPKDKVAKMQGIESYFLSTARSERAKNAAALENKDEIEEMNYFSRQSFLNALNSQRLLASNRLAIDIQAGILNALHGSFSGVVDGGVREGPFWVLAGALMPSVLLELGYITHPEEGKKLSQANYQKSLAYGIAEGIDGYFLKNFN